MKMHSPGLIPASFWQEVRLSMTPALPSPRGLPPEKPSPPPEKLFPLPEKLFPPPVFPAENHAITAKEADIRTTQGLYEEAQEKEEAQYNAMVARIQYLYENGDTFNAFAS